MRRAYGSAAMSLAALVLVGWLCASHADEVSSAIADIAWWGFAGAVVLHVATLGLRSEAWRLSLAAVGGAPLPRPVVHGANAAAFLAGAAQSQAALPARVAVLRRLAAVRAPRPAQICMADVPIAALELLAMSALLLAAALAGHVVWWIAPAATALALAMLLAARLLPSRLAHRPMLRGLAVLADRRRRGPLLALVASLSALTALRIWLVLLLCGLPHGLGEVAWLLAALGAFGLLPLGPGASPGATVATLGGAGVGAALGAGLVIAASSIAAVLAYAVVVALWSLWSLGERAGGAPQGDGAARAPSARRRRAAASGAGA